MAQGSRQIQSQAQQQIQTLSPQQILVVKLLGRQCLYLLLRLSLYLSGTLCHTYSFLLLAAKIMQTRQNKMNSFIFYAKVQLIFAFLAKIGNKN